MGVCPDCWDDPEMTHRSHRYLSRITRLFYRAKRYIRCGNRRRFVDLVKRNPKLLTRMEDSYSLLKWLVWRNNYEMAMAMLQLGADPDLGEPGDNTALIHAASDNDSRMVSLLLDFGADIEKANDRLETPLGFACSYDAVDAVRVLCERGADVNGTEDWGHSYLAWVRASNGGENPNLKRVEIEQILVSYGAQEIHTEPKLKCRESVSVACKVQ
jgi:hypothetical protein